MRKFWSVVFLIFFLLATFGMIAAIICQAVLVYQTFGEIDLHAYHVKHWTTSLWVSVVLYIPCLVIGFSGRI